MIEKLKDIHNEKQIYVDNENKSIKDLYNENISEVLNQEKLIDPSNLVEPIKDKKYSRTRMQSFTNQIASITIVKNNYFIGHLTSADLSILKDFETLKESLDIVNNCYVTISKPLLIDNTNIIIRDTMLLAPGGKKSLAHIGSLYDSNMFKKDIGDRINDMETFLKEDYKGFKDYALQDSIIALIHASTMEQFNFDNGSIGIPLTLSSLSGSYIKNY